MIEAFDAVGADVREHLQVAAGLRGGVRARRAQRVVLGGRDAGGDVAVDLVGRDLDEPGAVLARPLEQHVRPEDVGLDELGRAEDRAVDVRLGGEVDDGVAARAGPRDRLGVADVALDEPQSQPVEVRRVAGVRQLVEHDDLVAGRASAA